MLEDLKQCAPMVLEFLQHCCTTYAVNMNENSHIIARALRCFTSWVSVRAISLEGLSDNVILNLAFDILDFKPHEGKQVRFTSYFKNLTGFFYVCVNFRALVHYVMLQLNVFALFCNVWKTTIINRT